MICRTNLNNVQETGRLGNQMWAIASAIGIARKNNTQYYFPRWDYQKYFSNELPSSLDMRYYEQGHKIKEYREESPYYTDITLSQDYIWDLKGYFQSYKYFENHKEILWYYLNRFAWNPRAMFNGDVAIHVRRGDYLNLQHIHPVLGIEYYASAINKMKSYLGRDTKFVVFSDDNNLAEFMGIPVTHSENEMEDFILMCRCSHFIVANSSFSWWAAYLNCSPANLVIAPSTWVLNENRNDRIPPGWIIV